MSQDIKQIWVWTEAKEAVCKYCKPRSTPNQQVIASQAILLGLKELERQEQALQKESGEND